MTRPHPRRRTALTAVTTLSAVALLISACGADTASTSDTAGDGSSVTVGFSPFNQSAEALIGLGQGVTSYVDSQGGQVLIADPANVSETQIQQMQAWIENGQVQAIWVLALDTGAMKNTLELAQEKGVVVVAAGTPDQYGFDGLQPGLSFSNIDYDAYGTDLGTALGTCINERGDGAGKVIVLTPASGLAEASASAPMEAALAEVAPGAEIVTETQEGATALESQQSVASALQAHPDAIGVVSLHDEGAQGALVAFQQAGKDASASCIVNAGGATQNLDAVQSGDLYAVVALQFQDDLTQTVDLLLRMAEDPTAVGQQLTTPIKTITKDS